MDNALLIPLAGIALPIVLVPSVMAMKQARRKRECEHLERMKALETGQPVPGSNTWPAAVAIAIGAGVPIGAFFISWMACLTHAADESVFVGATLVGLGGVLGGTKLASRLTPSGKGESTSAYANKPHVDRDAFEVAGR